MPTLSSMRDGTTDGGGAGTDGLPATQPGLTPPDRREAKFRAEEGTGTSGRRGGPELAVVLAVVVMVAGTSVAARGLIGRETIIGRPKVGPEMALTPMNHSVGPSNNSPTIVADPTDGRFVAMANRMDAPDFSCALQVSGDGGRSWVPADPVPKLPKGAEKCYAPEIAFDHRGRLYYLFVGLAGEGNEPMGVFLTSSTDSARGFTEPREVLGPLNFAVRMAIDPGAGPQGRLHLVWIKATSDPPLGGFGPPPNPILSAHSDDGGETFSKPVQVNDARRQRVVAPALALGSDRRVHVAYYDLAEDVRDYQGLEGPVWEGKWSLVVATSADGGRRFGTGVVAEPAVTPFERVMLILTMPPPAVVVGADRVCLGWGDARHGDADVLVRCSDDGARSWRAARRVNDDSVGNGRSQYLPRLAVAPGGRLDAVFLDRREGPINRVNNVFFTYSTDGGRSFAPNLKVSAHGSDSQIGQQYANVSAQGKVELGSRLGLLSTGHSVVVAWPDTRNSRPSSTSQDLFSTVVTIPAGRERSLAWAAFGLALVFGGVLVVVAGRRRRAPSGQAMEET